ncbi:Fructokinase [Nocardioides aquaticus]|uniref:Fructokinase n=1 Tax=Nocardioides aquaticus TaxID=160826 RepID=A0ABX8EGD8_9ACTN|nr:carbohydrate kinase [Nocardioides aquaticus]QVT78691.1 Fructokinase [Nocardioides aquaticus]
MATDQPADQSPEQLPGDPATDPPVLVVGEALVDVVLDPDGGRREMPGGSAANVAVALARLGRPVRFATSYARDRLGGLVADHLAASGVEHAGDPRVLARTSTAEATLAPDGSASYVFDLEWRLGPMPDLTPRAVHVCSIGAVLDPGCRDVLAALERFGDAALVTYDVNVRPSITGTGPEVVARVERVAALADVVKASDEDLEALWPGLGEAGTAQHLLGLGASGVVVTRGASGAAWYDGRGVTEVGAVLLGVADTIGAGDTFSAGILDALWDDPDRDRAEVLAHAARLAAVTVSRPGADPPWRHEVTG